MNFAGVQSVTIPEGDVQRVAIGGVTVWTKPNPIPYDAEVEYLESTGTQYIDTGWTPASDYAKIEFEFTPTASLARKAVCGSEQSATVGVCRWLFVFFGQHQSYSRQYPLIRNWNNSSAYFDAPVGERRHVVWTSYAGEDSVFETVTGWSTTHTTSSVPLTTHLSSLKLFQNSSGQRSGIQLTHYKIWDNGVLVRDFVPVRVGTVGYLFDRVSGTLFGNAGTGSFVLGPDKNGGGA